jgi:hypothetical protein
MKARPWIPEDFFWRTMLMATEPLVILGVVHNGVVVPRGGAVLPEGVEVQITLPPIPPELQADFDAWENLGDEAWGLITEWEKEG